MSSFRIRISEKRKPPGSHSSESSCRISAQTKRTVHRWLRAQHSLHHLLLSDLLAKGLNHSRLSLLTCDIREAQVSPKGAVHSRGQRLRVWEQLSPPGGRAHRFSPLPLLSIQDLWKCSQQQCSTHLTPSPAEPFLSPSPRAVQ